MAKKTLLQMVQFIMSEMGSDEVNSIDETEESLQVTRAIEQTYLDLMAESDWAHLRGLGSLSSLSDTSKPNYLLVPESVKRIDELYYDQRRDVTKKKQLKLVKWLYPEEFLYKTNNYDSTADNIVTVTSFDGAEILVRNDMPPSFYTSFNDDYIVFDSWDSNVEATVQAVNAQAMVWRNPAAVTLADSTILDMPAEMFPTVQEMALSRCSANIAQERNQDAERAGSALKRRNAQKSWRVKGGIRLPNYARRTSYGRSRGRHPLDKN